MQEQALIAHAKAFVAAIAAGKPREVIESFYTEDVTQEINPSLLAPNGRPVQVTGDLESFWQKHYPPLRRELGRRYPKHAWPEDGRTAQPPPPKPPRARER